MRRKFPHQHSAAGFTLIELIVVMVIIGILFSIAAPGWLAFANRQRINSVRDEISQQIHRTQSEATRARRDRTLRVNTAVDPPTIQLVEVDPQPKVLGNGQIQAGMIRVQSNNNTLIKFNEQGTLVDSQGNPLDDGTALPKLTISLANNANIKGCVSIQSLLGATRTASGSDCN